MRERLADPQTWCLVAEVGGAVVGHIGIFPGEMSRAPTGDPGVAHLWQLFVRPAHQGVGVATALLHRGLAETAARGFERIRLFTPALQARARHFYEREGFTAPARPFDDQALGLAVVEYWRDLP